ncbi:carnitine O-acetyltransferase-like [Anser cygnoides]|uniref:carnitine O-acetyltransferase-like n=1 Tax=Anser cygnoides TaxID=8845 RepID=UPI0034D2CCDE
MGGGGPISRGFPPIWGSPFPGGGAPLIPGVPPPDPCPPPQAPPPPPWPALGATLGRYAGALRALLGARGWARSRALLQDFGAPGGAGPRLQERLRGGPPPAGAWPRAPGGRLPLPVHGSVGLVLPPQHWEQPGGQLRFAAQFVAGILDYRAMVERRDPPEPWVRAVFGGCRVPGPHQDGALRVPPGADPPGFITVIRNGQFFSVQACGGSGTPLPAAALGAQLGALRGVPGGGPGLGALTGEHRRGWGRTYGLLMRDRLNRASIGRIQRSLLALALDAPVMAAGGRSPGGGAGQVLHGGGAGANSCNRWFDKALQLIVGADGACGLLYDPEVIDGAVAAEMADHALAFCRRPAPEDAPVPALPPPQRLRFSLSPEIEPEVRRAKRHLDSLAADVEVHCFTHEGFGEAGPAQAEALLQVALQVAFYRVHGTLSACAEAPPLRPRPLPHPHLVLPPGLLCLRLARALQRPGTKPQALLSLLGAAAAAQRQRADEVAAGQGAERHLRALGLAAVGLGEPLPELFRDPGYARATHFRLCTLQVHSREACWPLRGPLVPDGYGVGVGHSPPPRRPPGDPPRPPARHRHRLRLLRPDGGRAAGGGPAGGPRHPGGAPAPLRTPPRPPVTPPQKKIPDTSKIPGRPPKKKSRIPPPPNSCPPPQIPGFPQNISAPPPFTAPPPHLLPPPQFLDPPQIPEPPPEIFDPPPKFLPPPFAPPNSCPPIPSPAPSPNPCPPPPPLSTPPSTGPAPRGRTAPILGPNLRFLGHRLK